MTVLENEYTYLLIGQCLIFLALTLLLVILSFRKHHQKRKIASYKAHFLQKIHEAYLQKRQDSPFSKVYGAAKKEGLLQALEDTCRNIKDEAWKTLRYAICQKHFHKPKLKVRSWKKRSQLARLIKLSPDSDDKERLRVFIQDSNFFIRSLACEAVASLGDKELILVILNMMKDSHKTTYYIYRTSFLLAKEESTQVLLEIYKDLPLGDPLRICCLEILSVLPVMVPPDSISQDLSSEDREMRETASRLIAKHSRNEFLPLLQRASQDPYFKVRLQAATGLSKISTQEREKLLDILLQDPVWQVRYEAAMSLIKSGDSGRRILAAQDESIAPIGYDVARYVLTSYPLGYR